MLSQGCPPELRFLPHADREAVLGAFDRVPRIPADFFVNGQNRGPPRLIHPVLELFGPFLDDFLPWPTPFHVRHELVDTHAFFSGTHPRSEHTVRWGGANFRFCPDLSL